MKYVNLFFHIYQPPVQDPRILDQIVRESYEPLTRNILKFTDLKFTMNINYSLVELLSKGYPEIIGNISQAFENGNLELTDTGAYHPIFPLIPDEEVVRQIEINRIGNKNFLNKSFQPEGIFPPEMAFDGRLISLFKSLNYKWTITDDSHLQFYGYEVPFDHIYSFEGLAVFLRSNFWANKFAHFSGEWQHGGEVVNELNNSIRNWTGDKESYIIIALDGETFGHHHKDLNEKFLIELFVEFQKNNNCLQLKHLSEIYSLFPLVPHFVPPGSWSIDLADIKNRDFFSWWKSERNPIHILQWQFMDFVLRIVRSIADNEINQEMDKALYSCQFWWASIWNFNPNEIYKGAFNMMRILQKAAEILGDHYDEIKEGEEIFRKLITAVEKKTHGMEENY
jgi:predicted glycosyl hydrolase (DUF1957 family)